MKNIIVKWFSDTWFGSHSLTISVRMNSKKINKQNYEKLKLGLLEIIAVNTELTVCFRQN